MNIDPLAGWIPIRVYWKGEELWVDWCYLGRERFIDPFFEQTIGVCLQRPFSGLFRHQTPIDRVVQLSSRVPCVPPSGFIFHMSRCGSTLITQMLASLPQNIVVSEAGPLDWILSAHLQNPRISEEQRIAWVRAMVCALGQQRNDEEQHYFIKFYSLHTIDLPLICQAFPWVPWIFLYRDPVEVMGSHAKERGGQMIPGLFDRVLGLDPASRAQMSLDEYCARALARICEAPLQHLGTGRRMLVNYRELPGAVIDSLLKFFKISFPAADIERMERVARFSAKAPSIPFTPDSETKQREATTEVRQLADRWVVSVYQQLEAARGAQGPVD